MSKEDPVYIATRQLRRRYGGVSHMWVERRMVDDPAFPKPVYFGARRFWAVAELEAWERATAAKPRSAVPA
jgi:predicted DNA-binding transcriptional regulator AlpA